MREGFKKVLHATLLGGGAIVSVSLLAGVFNARIANTFTEYGLMYIAYLFTFLLPPLFLMFYSLSLLLELIRRFIPSLKIPVFVIPFLFFYALLLAFSIFEPYMFEINTYLLLFLFSLILTICSFPIIRSANKAKT